MFEEIFEKIKEAPVITIFRHTQPDFDSLGSQRGMKRALQHLFPEKEIYMLGEQTKDGYVMDIVEDDDKVKDSLAILLDTANRERVDDQRYFEAKDKIRFDHHIKVDTLGDIDYVDTEAGATGEILASFFKNLDKEIGEEAAQDLYQALTSDTAKFTTSNTRPESLEAGAWLLRHGAKVVHIDQTNAGITLADFKYGALIRRKATTQNKLLFAVMSKTDWMTCGLNGDNAAKKAFMLGGVRDIDVWALFTEDSKGTFFGSLRSKTREVRDIAAEYGGGGHTCAAGVSNLTAAEVMEIVRKLSFRSIESDEERIAREERQKAEEEAKAALEKESEEPNIQEKQAEEGKKQETEADEAKNAGAASDPGIPAQAESEQPNAKE